MAQIKKFQPGGTAQPATRNNVFTIDGVAHKVDDELLRRMRDHAKSLDAGDSVQFGKIINALENGENLSYDSVQNSLTGQVNWDLKNERQKRRVAKRNRISGGLVADTQNAVGALRTFAPVDIYKVNSWDKDGSSKKKKDIKDWSKSYTIEYITDANGNKKLANTAANQLALGMLNSIGDISGYDADVDFRGYNGQGRDYYNAWLGARQGDSSIENLRQRMQDGILTDEDWKYLAEIGILNGTKPDPNADQKKRFADKGYDYNKLNKYITIDDNGNVIATKDLQDALGTTGNIWLNDEWSTDNNDLEALRHHMLWNGKLYKEDDAINQNWYKNNFKPLLDKGKRNEANQVMQFTTDIVERNRYNKTGPHYSKWMSGMGDNFWYSSLVGSHTTDGLQEGQQLIKYYDGTRDKFGRLTGEKYAVLDSNGDYVRDVDPSRISAIEGSEGAQKVTLAERISGDKVYNGYVAEEIGGGIDRGGFNLYTNPNNGEMIIDLGINAQSGYGSNLQDSAIRIPKILADKLTQMDDAQRENFWTQLINDEQTRKNFIRSLNMLTESDAGQLLRGEGRNWEWLKGISPTNPYFIADVVSTDPMTEGDWQQLGFTAEEAKQLRDQFLAEANNGNRFTRRGKYLVRKRTPIEFRQHGGTVGKSHIDTMPNVKVSSLSDAAGAEEILSGKLNDADWWQIGGIAADVGAVVANMSTVGTPVAVGLGLTGTGAQLISDIKRDGLDWGDVGNLAVGLGLDALTLIPNAGVSSMAKIGKNLAKSAGLIKKVLMAVGAVRGVQGLTAILNGEGTLDDWKALSQGLLVGQRLGKDVRNLAATKYAPKNPKATPKTKQDIQKQYIEEFIANNKDKVPANVKGVSAEGKVTNLAEAKNDLKGMDGFSLPDKTAALQAKAANAKGMFSSKWNPFSDQFIGNAENRVLTPETISAIKSGNSVWRANAAYELGHLNPHIHRQIYGENLLLPRNFDYNSPYIGNWFFRAPKFEGANRATLVVPTTTKAPYVAPAISHVEAPSNNWAPVESATSLVHMPNGVVTQIPANQIRISRMPIRRYVSPEVKEVARITPVRTISADQPSLPAYTQLMLPEFGAHHYLPITFRNSKGAIVLPPPEGTQLSLFKKGGKAKKVIKCQDGTSGSYNSIAFGNEEKAGYNWSPLISGISSLGLSIGSAIKSGELAKKGIDHQVEAQKYMPFYEAAPRYDESHLVRARDNALATVDNQPTLVTNDPRLQQAYNHEASKLKVGVVSDYHDKSSALQSQHDAAVLATNNQNRKAGLDAQNTATKAEHLGEAQKAMVDAGTLQSAATSSKNFLEDLRKEQLYRDAEYNQQLGLKADSVASELYSAELNKYVAEYNASKYEGTLEQYVQNNYPEKYNEIMSRVRFNTAQWYNRKKKNTGILPTPSFKKGSRIRPVTDEMLLENQKHTHKTIRDLNNNIVKMFLKIMS